MTKTSFHQILPECMDMLPQKAIDMLENTTSKTPCPILTVTDVLERAKAGHGYLYLATGDNGLVGVLYMVFLESHYGRVLNLVELGGENLMAWKDDLREFIRKLMIANQCSRFMALTREGMGKIFPELQPKAVLLYGTVTH